MMYKHRNFVLMCHVCNTVHVCNIGDRQLKFDCMCRSGQLVQINGHFLEFIWHVSVDYMSIVTWRFRHSDKSNDFLCYIRGIIGDGNNGYKNVSLRTDT